MQTRLAVLALALTLGSCQQDATPDETITLNVYSARHYDVDQQLYDGFEEATGISVALIEGKDDALLARLESEGERSPCDVFITVDAARLWLAEDAGHFQPTSSAALEERVPAHLRHPDGLWFGLSTRARCIAYSKERVDESELSSYEDLADPRWRERVLIRSSSNVYNQSLVGSLIEAHGVDATEAWARGLVANFARAPQGGDTDQIRAIAAGEGDVAVVNSYYYARLLKSDKPEDKAVVAAVGLFFPNQADRGAHVNVSGAGVATHAPHPDAARQFIEYLTSDEAQKLFAQGNNEFPVVDTVATDPVLAPWADAKRDTTTNVAAFGKQTRAALELMDRAGWR